MYGCCIDPVRWDWNTVWDQASQQYIMVEGRPVIAYCVGTLALYDLNGWREPVRKMLSQESSRGFSVPGKERRLSILQGLGDKISGDM